MHSGTSCSYKMKWDSLLTTGFHGIRVFFCPYLICWPEKFQPQSQEIFKLPHLCCVEVEKQQWTATKGLWAVKKVESCSKQVVEGLSADKDKSNCRTPRTTTTSFSCCCCLSYYYILLHTTTYYYILLLLLLLLLLQSTTIRSQYWTTTLLSCSKWFLNVAIPDLWVWVEVSFSIPPYMLYMMIWYIYIYEVKSWFEKGFVFSAGVTLIA